MTRWFLQLPPVSLFSVQGKCFFELKKWLQQKTYNSVDEFYELPELQTDFFIEVIPYCYGKLFNFNNNYNNVYVMNMCYKILFYYFDLNCDF